LKGQRLDEEITEAAKQLVAAGFASVEALTVGSEWKTEETRVFRATLEAVHGS